jgi:hypothetical protein
MALDMFPKAMDQKSQKLNGSPSPFDDFVLEFIAKAIPMLLPAEKPSELWRPILELGAVAHKWIERFFSYWFILGARAKFDQTNFFKEWREMIEFALSSSKWDQQKSRRHYLDSMVVELLGFNSWRENLRDIKGFAQHIEGMADLYERVAAKWLSLPKVLRGFVGFFKNVAARSLALKSIPWIVMVAKRYDDYDWQYGTEEALIEFLDSCWQSDEKKITGDEVLRKAFFEVVNVMVARGSHAALALRDRVLQSLTLPKAASGAATPC